MKNLYRRSFVKQLFTGIAGTVLLSSYKSSDSDFPLELINTNDNSEAFWETVKSQFKFAPNLRYFNNGSLGSCPVPVQKATNEYRATLDGFPSKYMWGGWNDEKETVRQKVADFFSVSNEEIALTHNTTEGMNLIARSFNLEAGDEVILIDHEHKSSVIPWTVWQEEKGIKLVRPVIAILPETVEDLVKVYENAITSRTKVISMCHSVNTNGMILPVKEVSEMAHEKGILVAVDGAQAAGMFDINLKDLGCDFYAVSAHKWLFAPKGIAMFYAKKESQHYLKPLIVANGHTDESIRRLENYNTRNLPELLGLGSAVDFINTIGKEKVSQRSYELKHYFRNKVKDNPKFKLKTPGHDDLSCAIQTLEVIGKDVKDVKNKLSDDYGIDTRPMSTYNLNGVRISFAIFITKKDIDDLVNALETIAG
ncbi:MAG: aminotransferase class V-fold PLP-dependent enzyme [Flavobacteriaceae bacterium]|nr:aminotransferase class V-fold PLP-dependent enzyme [Flavobacteriaceae bacterium]